MAAAPRLFASAVVGSLLIGGTPAQLRDNPWVQRSNLGALAERSGVGLEGGV